MAKKGSGEAADLHCCSVKCVDGDRLLNHVTCDILCGQTHAAVSGSKCMDIHAEVTRAEERIRPYVRETPLVHSLALSQAGATAYLKLENIQHTGSFKVRGALNKLLSLTPEQRAGRRDGVVGQSRRRCGLRAEAAGHTWPDLCAGACLAGEG
jgi:hypothetical protein